MLRRVLWRVVLAVGVAGQVLAQPGQVKVGAIVPLSGDFVRYGEKVRLGIERVSKPGISLVYEDEGCAPAKAVSAYRKLSSVDGIKVFIGPSCGTPQMAVAPLLPEGGQVAVLGAAAPRAVFEASKGRMFSAQHSLEEESAFNAVKLYELGMRRVVIVFFESSFGRAHERAFREGFQGEVLDTLAYSSSDVSILKSLALKIRKLSPDAVYVPDALPLMQGFMRELAASGISAARVFSIYSAQSEDVLNAMGPQGEGLTYSYPDIGERDALEYFPEVAARILVSALNECRSANDRCLIDSLRRNNKFDQYGVLQASLGLRAIRQGKFVKFSGVDLR